MTIIILFVSAFLVRLIGIGQSLWLDESIVAKVVRTISFFQIPIQLSPGDVHPPLYYLVISLWTSLFGTSEIALRMPSVIFSLIAGWYVYKMGGKWAAAFFLFNPLIIYYSQEARMHMMATMFLSAALYHFMSLRGVLRFGGRRGNLSELEGRNDILLFNLFSALAMFTFYGSGFFIAAMIVAGGRDLEGRGIWQRFFYLFIGSFISLLALSPLLYQQLLNSRAGLAELRNWSQALGNVDIKNIGLIFIKFATGRLSWYPKWSYYLVAGIPTAIIWIYVFIGMKKQKILAFLFVFPLIIGILISFIAPMMMYFRFLYLIPVMSLLIGSQIGKPIGKQITKLIEKLINNPILTANIKKINNYIGFYILFSYFAFSFVYLFVPLFHREDWKSLSQTLVPSVPVFMILPSSDPISYYRNDIALYELRNVKSVAIPEKINVIPYTNGIYGLDYVKLLQEAGCVRESQTNFRGDVSVESWKCLKNA